MSIDPSMFLTIDGKNSLATCPAGQVAILVPHTNTKPHEQQFSRVRCGPPSAADFSLTTREQATGNLGSITITDPSAPVIAGSGLGVGTYVYCDGNNTLSINPEKVPLSATTNTVGYSIGCTER